MMWNQGNGICTALRVLSDPRPGLGAADLCLNTILAPSELSPVDLEYLHACDSETGPMSISPSVISCRTGHHKLFIPGHSFSDNFNARYATFDFVLYPYPPPCPSGPPLPNAKDNKID